MKDNALLHEARAEQREKVIVEAWAAFTKRGIKNVRMDDIASSLRMSKRTLYEIFEDKETLLKECFLYHKQKRRAEFLTIISSSKSVLEVIMIAYKEFIEVYQQTDKSFFEDIQKYPKINCLFEENREEEDEYTINFLQQGIEQGVFRDDINYYIIRELIRELMHLLMTSEIMQSFPFLEAYENLFLTVLRGISTPAGVEELDNLIVDYYKKTT